MYKLSEINGKKIALVDMLSEKNTIFSDLLSKTIKKYKKLGKKILFIVNRKGYNSSFLCLDCGYIPKCEYCDVPIGKYHYENKFIHMCAICKRVYPEILQCKNCGSTKIKEIGIGTYKFKEILDINFGISSLVVENTDINSINKIKKKLSEIEKAQFIISTNIFTANNIFNPDLIVFPNVDTGLSIPDYNVGEKHFLMLYEFIKNYKTLNFLLQTFNSEHYVYKYLLKLDLDGFWKEELKYRKQFKYPPFAQLAVLTYKNQIEEKLYSKISKIESELKYLIQNLNSNVEIYSTPQLVFKKFGKYHFNIVLKGTNLKSFLDKAVEILKLKNKGFQIDWLPSNLI